MEKSNIEIINESLDEIIFGEEPLILENIEFEMSLCDIVLRSAGSLNVDGHLAYKNMYKTRTDMTIEHAKKIALEFFKVFNEQYYEKLKEAFENNLFCFKPNLNGENSYFLFDEDGEKIIIYYHSSIEDVYEIVHEFMHYLNNNSLISSDVSSYYTECFSVFVELILADFLIKNYPNYKHDASKMKRNVYFAVFQSCIKNKILYEMIISKQEGREINLYELAKIYDILKGFIDNDDLIELALGDLVELMMDDVDFAFINACRYSIALPLAIQLYNTYNSNNGKKKVIDLNDNLHVLDADAFIKCLNLESSDDEYVIDDDVLEKLEKDYKIAVKKLW